MADEAREITGGCNCGAVRYAIASEPLAIAVCHCTHCRAQSGSAYSVNMVVRASTMTVEGQLTEYTQTDTDSGAPLARQFCGKCGSPIRSVSSAAPKIAAVKVGTLDSADAFPPTVHIWTQSKLPWVTIPEGMPSFPKGPQA
ncbi:GFA family protein [Sphingosinithalassobacter portus]|uniref:GFA family protein n=1 Tax=Stakelama portus TaxID=2676234 RepID=UPI000D6E064A|nr:GFA family protein [Sphingosinithalassobacter portus]